MRIGSRTIAPVLALTGLLVALSCTEDPLPTATESPDAAVVAAAGGGGNNAKVKVKQLQLSSNTLRIDGPPVSGTVSIGNSGQAIQSGVSIRGDIVQGAATWPALLAPVNCSAGQNPLDNGKLPTGTCEMSFDVAVSSLSPGGAVLVMTVLQDGVELASKSLDVTLVATPMIASVTLASTTIAIEGPATTFTAVLQNPANSLQGVVLQGYIAQTQASPPAKRASGGVSVTCGGAPGVLTPGTCTVSFSVSAGNGGAGTGTLTPGDALFELDLVQNNGGTSTTLDFKTVPITLVSSAPKIADLQLASNQLPIGGAGVDYTATLQNYGFPVSDVILQGEIVQDTEDGTATHGAGGTLIDCGSGLGTLPTTATCTVSFTAVASNATGGSGTLVPGLARLVLHLYAAPVGGPETELDSRTVEVLLTDDSGCFPALPKPQVTVESRTWDNGFDHVELDVPNYSSFPDVLFAPAPDLPPCGANTSSSRTWVDIVRGDDGSYVYGFCSFGQASDLDLLYYSWPLDQSPPTSIIVRITDRQCGIVYESDPVDLPTVIQ